MGIKEVLTKAAVEQRVDIMAARGKARARGPCKAPYTLSVKPTDVTS